MMSLSILLIVIIIFFAFCIYACFLVPEGNVGRFCTKALPFLLCQQMEKMVGKKVMSRLERLKEHTFQLGYLTIVLGAWSIMFCYGYEQIEKSDYIDNNHKYSGYIVFLLCMSSFHCACNVRPGTVTAKTMALFDHYEYDNVLYKNQLCPTLRIRKIARSKYDRFSGQHVPRFDHYCGWINQPVGEQNYRWFLLFLTVHVCMCCYGSWAVFRILYGEVMEKNLLNATFINAKTGEEVSADSFIVFHYLYMRHLQLCSIFILMSVMAIVLGIFLCFHLYISSKNMTTNEFFKWKGVRKWHKKEKQKYEQWLQYREVVEKKTNSVRCTTGPRGEVRLQTSASVVPVDEIIDPGRIPSNIYDKGIVANFKEVLFPYSFCEEAMQRYLMSLSNVRESTQGEEQSNLNGREGKPKAI